MVDWLTLTFTIIITISLIIANIYLLAYYCHPDDKGTAMGIIIKVFVVIGLGLAWAQVLMVPLDVSNNRTFGGGLDMKLFWFIIFMASVVYVLFFFPILTGLYETDPDWSCCDKFKHSFCCFICTMVVIVAIGLILYFTIGNANIPIDSIYCQMTTSNIQDSSATVLTVASCDYDTDTKIEVEVSFMIYCVAVMSFISWFIFAIFGGIGLAAIPLDFFHDFCTRPKTIKSEEIEDRRKELVRNIDELKLLGEKVKDMEDKGYNKEFIWSKKRRNYNKKNHEFKAGAVLAEKEFYVINIAQEMKQEQCYLICYFLLIPFGIITSIITILWIIQFICTYFYMKDHRRAGYPFLSYMFIYFQDHNVAFLSFIFFSIFCLYLLWATMKGNIKFGVRFLCCWSVHPMKKDETYMNSFLFNVSLILLGSISITQFCANSFPDYVTFTDIDMIFNVQIKYLDFFVWFYKYHVFEYILFGIFVISLIYLLLRPRDQVTAEMIYEKKKVADEEIKLKSNNNSKDFKELK